MDRRARSGRGLALAALAMLACGGGTTGAPQQPAGSDAGAGTDGGTAAACQELGGVACAFLEAHDTARASAKPPPSPALDPMTWSTSAASAADAWSRRCTWAHDPALQSEGLGQNLYASTKAPDPGTVVTAWVAEVASYDYASNTCAAGQVCGHYTQVVWRSSTGLGCATHECATGSPFGAPDGSPWWISVCDYAPPGNIVGQRPY